MSLTLKKPTSDIPILPRAHFLSHSTYHGQLQLHSAEKLLAVDRGQREERERRRWGEQMRILSGSSLPLSRLFNSLTNHCLHCSHRQASPILPHSSSLPHLQKKLPLDLQILSSPNHNLILNSQTLPSQNLNLLVKFQTLSSQNIFFPVKFQSLPSENLKFQSLASPDHNLPVNFQPLPSKNLKLKLIRQTLPSLKLSVSFQNLLYQNVNVRVRLFSSFTDGGTDSGDESDGEEDDNSQNGDFDGENVKSSADPAEVESVCKVIDELFALDLNMEAVLDECGINLSHDLVVDVLERFRHARKPAFRFFCWAGGKPGFAHDSRTYNAMMRILAKSRQFETMVSVLEEMGMKRVLTMDTFMIAMRAFAAARERRKAIGVFELMKKYKYKVRVETFNSLLDSLGRAKLGKEAQVLFEKMEDKFVPNLRTYTVLLNGWCRVKKLMEAGRIWNEMIDKGFKPDVIAHNVMLEGLLRSKKRSDAIKLFEVMKAKGPLPDVRSYTILIWGLCKQRKMEVAVQYFEEMVDAGCKPDAAVYTCLLIGFGNQKRMDVVYQLLKEMKQNGCPPDGRTYNALIKLMTSQRMPDNALRIYKRMTESGIEPTIHTYNMIMKSYFRTRNYEMGHEVWDEMRRNGCCPDDNSYTVLIGGLISQGRSREACKYLEEMMEKGMKAPQLDYKKFAADFSRSGNPSILEELAEKMMFSGKFEVSNFFARSAETLKKKAKRRDLFNRVDPTK